MYYHQAAMSAIARKKLSHNLCHEASITPPSELATPPETTYYGQRPWRVGLTGMLPLYSIHHKDCLHWKPTYFARFKLKRFTNQFKCLANDK